MKRISLTLVVVETQTNISQLLGRKFFLIYDKPILIHSFKNCWSKLERHN